MNVFHASLPDRGLFALDGNPLDRPRLDSVLDKRVGRGADQYLPGLRRFFEPFREDDRLAGHERVPFRRIPGQDLTGVDPDPGL